MIKAEDSNSNKIVDAEEELIGEFFLEDWTGLTLYKSRVIFSWCDAVEDKEIYISQAVIGNHDIKFIADISYTLFNKGQHTYEAAVDTLTIINPATVMGRTVKITIGDKAVIGMLQAISDSNITKLRDIKQAA